MPASKAFASAGVFARGEPVVWSKAQATAENKACLRTLLTKSVLETDR